MPYVHALDASYWPRPLWGLMMFFAFGGHMVIMIGIDEWLSARRGSRDE